MSETILTPRDLNRALLARQMLLARQPLSPAKALTQLLAIQAQLPRAPSVGLWSRLADFQPTELREAIGSRQVVRATAMRGTLHLMTAGDFLAFRGCLRTGETLALPGGSKVTVTELEPVLELARRHFAQPKPFDSLRDALAQAGHTEVRLMAYAARLLLPLVQAPVDTPYGFSAGGEFILAKALLGKDIEEQADPADLLRRYLAVWGPATPGDFSRWSGLKGVASLFAALGEELLRFRDEAGRTLYDLKAAPRPGADTPAAPRLLPDFDAVTLGHQDRARVLPPEHAPRIASRNLQVPSLLLVDGFVAGTWKLETKRKVATVTLTGFAPLSAANREATEAEALSLASTFEPGARPALAWT